MLSALRNTFYPFKNWICFLNTKLNIKDGIQFPKCSIFTITCMFNSLDWYCSLLNEHMMMPRYDCHALRTRMIQIFTKRGGKAHACTRYDWWYSLHLHRRPLVVGPRWWCPEFYDHLGDELQRLGPRPRRWQVQLPKQQRGKQKGPRLITTCSATIWMRTSCKFVSFYQERVPCSVTLFNGYFNQ